MNAGLPGVGIAGLFFVISALLMPVVELVRTVAGRSSAERWRGVAHDWLLAVAMLAAFVAMGWALTEKVPEPLSEELRSGVPTRISAMAVTVVILAALLVATQLPRLLGVRRGDHARSAGRPARPPRSPS